MNEHPNPQIQKVKKQELGLGTTVDKESINSGSGRSIKPSLVRNSSMNSPHRQDTNGNTIRHGGNKKHHIEFRDDLEVVYEVPSYKRYNTMDRPTCCCSVF